MKQILKYAFVLGLSSTTFFSCSKDEVINNSKIETVKKDKLFQKHQLPEDKFNESLNKWEKLKAENGDSYTYQTQFVSWTGFRATTTLTIEEGKVVSRSYRETNSNQEVTFSYIETSAKDNLGSHKYRGASVLTIDDLYKNCIDQYLVVDESNNSIYFETDDNGLMTLCGYVPNNCMDDCFMGVRVSSFDWL